MEKRAAFDRVGYNGEGDLWQKGEEASGRCCVLAPLVFSCPPVPSKEVCDANS
jgi:hypothetical protein